jgi:DegV family protein with EDD domain
MPVVTKRTALVTDSTCNLPADLAAERHIYMAPLYIIWDDESLRDGVDITAEAFYKRLATSKSLPKTSQVSVQDFVDLFEKAREAEQADEVICTVISSELSGTYASAVQAASQVDFPVRLIDTLQTSWALGFPVLSAADARDAGADGASIEQVIRSSMVRQRLIFTIDSLEFLHRGGRIGNARLLLGSALHIKPILELDKGIVTSAENVRTRKRAVEQMLTVAANRAQGSTIRRLAAIHCDVEAQALHLLESAKARFKPEETHVSYITAVLGTHVGPGALGIVVEWDN